MKRIIAIIIIVLLIAVFGGCKNSNKTIQNEGITTNSSSDSVTEEVSKPANINNKDISEDSTGIMILSSDEENNKHTIKLDIIDPDTGEVRNFRTFSKKGNSHNYSGDSDAVFFYPAENGRGLFNDDFTKVLIDIITKNKEYHVGWIDQEGNITDVSKIISKSSDFYVIKHFAATFFGEYFYFIDQSERQIKRVPIDNLSPESVEIIEDDYSFTSFRLHPDGEVATDDYQYYDDSMRYPARGVSDWISESICVGVDEQTGVNGNIVYKYYLDGAEGEGVFDWYREKTAITKFVEGRRNWSPVVSPDCSQIAFLSRRQNEASLFVVSSDGGEPTKIETQYPFPNNYSNNAKYIVLLLDWQ